jgi:hypothetical protein
MASQILGRRATSAADYRAAFTVERIDVIAEIVDEPALLALGRNTVGPGDGLYVLEEDGGFRVYVQERGIPFHEARGLDFDQAREAVIDRVLMMNGIPFTL